MKMRVKLRFIKIYLYIYIYVYLLMLAQNESNVLFYFTYSLVRTLFVSLRYGLGVRIAGSHPAGPGSIPGNGNLFFSFFPATF